MEEEMKGEVGGILHGILKEKLVIETKHEIVVFPRGCVVEVTAREEWNEEADITQDDIEDAANYLKDGGLTGKIFDN